MRTILAALVVLAALPPVALGVGSERVLSSLRTQSPDAAASAKVQCPAGKQLTGGGYGLLPSYDPIALTGAQSLVQQGFPAGPRLWTVRSFATASGTDSRLYAAGLCRKGRITRRSTPYPIAAASHLVARVKCPTNRHVVGGGFSVFPPYDPSTGTGSNVSVHTSRRLTTQQWLVGATRDYGPEATVTA